MIGTTHSITMPRANRGRRDSPFLARRGFSLLEMLLVMGILVLVAAFALPALNGSLEKSRLRSGARDVHAALSKARALAIREGQSLEFLYEVNGPRWKIERPDRQASFTGADSVTSSGLRVDQAAVRSRVVRQGTLPDGTTFIAPSDRGKPDDNDIPGDLLERLPTSFEDPSTARWSDPIAFYANGRSVDSELRIRGNSDFVVAVAVRGLTSTVSFSDPFRPWTADGQRFTDDAASDRSVRNAP